MASLPTNQTITANGDYDLTVNTGGEFIFTLKGTFGGATVALKTISSNGTVNTVASGSFTAETEQLFFAPSSTLRLTVSGASGSTSIEVTCIEREYNVN